MSWALRDERDGTAHRPGTAPPRESRRRQVRLILLLILALGLALTAIGLLLARGQVGTGTRVTSALVSALAGGLIGASVSSFVNWQYESPVLDEMWDVMRRTSACALTSADAGLEHLRRPWHHYHLTMSEGKAIWRYARMAFDNHDAVGALTADVPVIDAIGGRPPRVYKTDAAVWDRRLVLLQTRMEGDEAAVVEVFPDVSGFRSLHAGVGIMQSWSSHDVLVPTLISDQPLFDRQPEGSITDDRHAERLAALWHEHFEPVHRLLPVLARPPA